MKRGWIKVLGVVVGFAAHLNCAAGRAAPQEEGREKPRPSNGHVRVISGGACAKGERQTHVLAVTCQGLVERQVQARERRPQKSIGTAVLAMGGYGTGAYPEEVVGPIHDAGYQTFVVVWQGKRGWGTGLRGKGITKAMCGYADVVRWIAARRADKPELICATGNSGGSFQIAYGLSVYGLEDLLDMVVLTGGPPVSRLDWLCFGGDTQEAKEAELPKTSGARRIIDHMMGWEGNGDYCRLRLGSPERLRMLQRDSLVSPLAERDYTFPATRVNCLNSEGDSLNSHNQGRIYFNKVTSPKAWHEIPGRAHGIPRSAGGARKIIALFVERAKAQK